MAFFYRRSHYKEHSNKSNGTTNTSEKSTEWGISVNKGLKENLFFAFSSSVMHEAGMYIGSLISLTVTNKMLSN